METEQVLVYSIISTVKKGVINDDTKVDERVVRAFLCAYRAAIIYKYSLEGLTISDECFQYLGPVQFDFLKPRFFTKQLPAIIRLKDNFGMIFRKNGEVIPVQNSEAFHLGLKNIINGKLPKAMFLSKKATVFIGQKITTSCGPRPGLNTTITDFEDELIDTAGQSITIDVHAILANPDDCPDYDWTKDPYPMPSETIEEMRRKILQVEYGIILQIKTDKVADGNESETQQDQK